MSAFSSYLNNVHRLSYNFIFAGVLLALYEIPKLLLDMKIVNAVDVALKGVFEIIPYGTLGISIALVGIGLIVIARDLKQGVKIDPGQLMVMFAESALWALVIFFGLHQLVRPLVAPGSIEILSQQAGVAQEGYLGQIVNSFGAGFYEELFFRLILAKFLLFIMAFAGQNIKSYGTKAVVIVITAALFSLVHFDFVLGGTGEPFTMYAFLYRFMFGVVMNMLLFFRGFGITAWTHGLFDVYVFTFRALVG